MSACPYDEELDATDGACPAFWRGSKHGVEGAVMRVRQALEGEAYQYSCQELTDVCRQIVALKQELREVESKPNHIVKVIKEL